MGESAVYMTGAELRKIADDIAEQANECCHREDSYQCEISDLIFEALTRVQKEALGVPYREPSDWDHHWETPEESKERDELYSRRFTIQTSGDVVTSIGFRCPRCGLEHGTAGCAKSQDEILSELNAKELKRDDRT
jgi:hypothetical protein